MGKALAGGSNTIYDGFTNITTLFAIILQDFD